MTSICFIYVNLSFSNFCSSLSSYECVVFALCLLCLLELFSVFYDVTITQFKSHFLHSHHENSRGERSVLFYKFTLSIFATC